MFQTVENNQNKVRNTEQTKKENKKFDLKAKENNFGIHRVFVRSLSTCIPGQLGLLFYLSVLLCCYYHSLL